MHTDIGGELINLSVPIDREAPTQPDYLLKESAERIGRSAVSSIRSKPPKTEESPATPIELSLPLPQEGEPPKDVFFRSLVSIAMANKKWKDRQMTYRDVDEVLADAQDYFNSMTPPQFPEAFFNPADVRERFLKIDIK
jgi:hypothetical protein